MNAVVRKKILIPISLFVSLKMNVAGLVNKEIQNKLNPYVPNIEVMLKNSNWLEKLYTIKFHGKPVKIEPLINSSIPKIREKIKNEFIIFFGFRSKKIKETKP